MISEKIADLSAALAKSQSVMKPAVKDGKNPHLKNSYATLDSIIASARKPLADNELSFSQLLQEGDDGLLLETFLFHSSGQWLKSEVKITPATGNRGVNDMQALGSALTYLKRYALAAMLGVSVEDDDDGNNATPQKLSTTNKTSSTSKQSGKSNNGKPVDPMTQFWVTCKAYDLTKEQGQEILKANDNDAVQALNALEGHKQAT